MTEQHEQRMNRLTVGGYKSIEREQSIELRPLTILAGANSSGKSSMVQPLLLLKQTLEATYDPGTLLLNGPNVAFSSVRQMLPRTGRKLSHATLRFGIGFGINADLTLDLTWQPDKKLAIERMAFTGAEGIELRPGMRHDAILEASTPKLRHELEQSLVALASMYQSADQPMPGQPALKVTQRRCFLDIALLALNGETEQPLSLLPMSFLVEPAIRAVIHVPGLREMPERAYPVTASGPTFPGTFPQYAASVIAQWQENEQLDLIERLGQQLAELGLTRQVKAVVQDETRIEIQVGRLPPDRPTRSSDLVNIADVGVGVSQTLPVLVALLAAAPGQLVYIEQPEIHLHPRAQVALARILADAARRGVQVVVETHSSLLLLGVQALVAEGTLGFDLVKLHWFARDRNGMTVVTTADLDRTGAFGDWPEDFGAVELQAQNQYIDAAEARLKG